MNSNPSLQLLLEQISSDPTLSGASSATVDQAVELMLYVTQGFGHVVAKKVSGEKDYSAEDPANDYVGIIDDYMAKLSDAIKSGKPAQRPSGINSKVIYSELEKGLSSAPASSPEPGVALGGDMNEDKR